MFAFLRRSAVLVGLLAAFLSIGLVAPSAANADALPQPKPMPPNVRHLFSIPNQVGGSTLPVAPTPAGTGGQVIKGPWRVYPGTTKVIPPSLLKIIKGSPALGLGMGASQTASPLDYIRGGASWGCAFADFACSDGERQIKRDQDKSVTDQPGVFGVPLFNDAWAWLTGQTTEGAAWIPIEADLTSGSSCTKALTYSGGNNGSFTMTVTRNSTPGSPGSPAEQLYTAACGPESIGARAHYHATCQKPDGTKVGALGNTNLAALASVSSSWSPVTGLNVSSPCGTAAGMTLVDLTWFYVKLDPQKTQRTSPGHWVNPDPTKDLLDAKTEITTEVTCKATDGTGTVSTVIGVTGASSFVGMPICPPGTLPIAYSVNGGLPGQKVEIAGGGLAAGAEDKAPACLGSQATGCAMTVELDGQACTTRVVGCADWANVYSAQPSRIQCKYGGYAMPGSDCLSVLKDAYKTETGVSYNPAYPNTAPAPTNIYNQWINPSPEPWNPTSPANQPAPGGSTSTSPAPFPITGANPSFNWDNCIAGGSWSWNPVDWVATPVSCVMQAMFKPDPAKGQQRADAMKAKMATVGVEPLITAVNTNITAIAGVAGGSGCSGPAVQFDASGISKTIYPFNACEQPISTLAMLSNALATMVLVVGGGFGMVRAVAMGFGFNFTMGRTGGGDS